MEGRVFEFSQKKSKKSLWKFAKKKSKNFQSSKNAQNRPQKSPNVFRRCFRVIFLKNFFCPVFHGRSSLRIFSKKSKKFQNSKKAQNRSQKCPKVFWTSLGLIFSKKKFCPVFDGGSSLWKFAKKKSKKFSKFQKCPKSSPKESKRVLKMF